MKSLDESIINIEIIKNNDIAFIEQNGGIDQKHYLINLFEVSEIKETMIFDKPATVFCMKNGNYYSIPTPYEKIKKTLAEVGYTIISWNGCNNMVSISEVNDDKN